MFKYLPYSRPLALAAVVFSASGLKADPAFPLHVSPNGHYLVDALGQPFLHHADTPWRLITHLTTSEAVEYLDQRKKEGWSAVNIMLLPFAAATNVAGQKPFENGDFLKPNDAYFNHADSILTLIEEHGMFSVLSSNWFGYNAEQWFNALTDANAYAYGRFLGKRFHARKNIMWILGGDHDPGIKLNALAHLAQGIKEESPHHLITYHPGPGSSGASKGTSARFFHDSTWFDVNFVYYYPETYSPTLYSYQRAPHKPVVLGESGYEGESNDGRGGAPQRVRRQAWWVMLSGGCGHSYGSGTLWQLNSGWKEKMLNPGAKHLGYLMDLLRTLPWTEWVPDTSHQLVTAGYGIFGDGDNYVTAAKTPPGGLALIYLPTARTLKVDLRLMNQNTKATWIDPTTGLKTVVAGSPFPNAEPHDFTPPDKNASGDSDWALLLEAYWSKPTGLVAKPRHPQTFKAGANFKKQRINFLGKKLKE